MTSADIDCTFNTQLSIKQSLKAETENSCRDSSHASILPGSPGQDPH